MITSNSSSLPEAGGKDSVYINPENFEDIQAKILFLWNNEAERKRRADKGFLYAENFRDEIIATELMKIYREVI